MDDTKNVMCMRFVCMNKTEQFYANNSARETRRKYYNHNSMLSHLWINVFKIYFTGFFFFFTERLETCMYTFRRVRKQRKVEIVNNFKISRISTVRIRSRLSDHIYIIIPLIDKHSYRPVSHIHISDSALLSFLQQ